MHSMIIQQFLWKHTATSFLLKMLHVCLKVQFILMLPLNYPFITRITSIILCSYIFKLHNMVIILKYSYNNNIISKTTISKCDKLLNYYTEFVCVCATRTMKLWLFISFQDWWSFISVICARETTIIIIIYRLITQRTNIHIYFLVLNNLTILIHATYSLVLAPLSFSLI
jgi:hypothetical protein